MLSLNILPARRRTRIESGGDCILETCREAPRRQRAVKLSASPLVSVSPSPRLEHAIASTCRASLWGDCLNRDATSCRQGLAPLQPAQALKGAAPSLAENQHLSQPHFLRSSSSRKQSDTIRIVLSVRRVHLVTATMSSNSYYNQQGGYPQQPPQR